MRSVTELGDDTKYAVCYPSISQYEQWVDHADRMGYDSVSQFMTEMIEAGYTQIDSTVTYDEETSELRTQRNELKQELDAARERIENLEEQLYRGERRSILQFLAQKETGASFAEIVQHLINDTPARVAEILEEMEAEQIESVNGRYQPVEGEFDDIK